MGRWRPFHPSTSMYVYRHDDCGRLGSTHESTYRLHDAIP